MFFSTILLSVGLVEMPADTLETVIVTADKGSVVSKADTLSIKSGQSVGDALQSFSSLHFSDNGGDAGLKTAALRGLGSAHTSIYLDGVRIGNVQSGQTDLGMLCPNTYSTVVIDYAQNALYFYTKRPTQEKKVSGDVSFTGGSFSTYKPSARLNVALTDSVMSSFYASGLWSKGDYKYRNGQTVRENNDIKKGQFGTDFWGITKKGSWSAKAYLNTTERGVPGSTLYPSTDRQGDNNALVQGLLSHRFTDLYQLDASAKFSFDHLEYLSTWGNNYYDQYEGQVNTAHLFRICKWFDLSLASDFQIDNLDSDNYSASRKTFSEVATASFKAKRVKAKLTADYEISLDNIGENRNALSPSLDLRVGLIRGLDFVGFVRRSYRMPTFNELYYVGFGNPELKCEDALLSEYGLEYSRHAGCLSVKAKADGFLNNLKDKIISAPSPEDPNIWAPYNIGKVKVAGFDVASEIGCNKDGMSASLSVRYTMTNALDKTPDSYTFDQQIPYIAKHSFVATGEVGDCGWLLSAAYNLRAERRDASGELPAWSTLDMRVSKTFAEKYRVFFVVKNLLDEHYEISSGYPMQGRSVEGGFNISF